MTAYFRFAAYNILKNKFGRGDGLQVSLLIYELTSNLLDIRSEIGDDSLSMFHQFKAKFTTVHEEAKEIDNINFTGCYATWLKNSVYAITNIGIEFLI